jgi:hypothetical protein
MVAVATDREGKLMLPDSVPAASDVIFTTALAV